jgi:hypothetical protein
MWKWIKNIIGSLFKRSERIELAVKITKALKSFTDTKADNVLAYILSAVGVPYVTNVKDFLEKNLPAIVINLEMMDVSDEGKTTEECCLLIAKKLKEYGTVKKEEEFATAIAEAMKNKKLSYLEAIQLSKYLEQT